MSSYAANNGLFRAYVIDKVHCESTLFMVLKKRDFPYPAARFARTTPVVRMP
jgi:hypothetical protein